MSQERSVIKTTFFSLLSNIVLAIIKGLAGVFGHSYALVADAIESTADIFSSCLVLAGLKYATRPADHNHPYGHGKLEALITFAVVAFLVVAAFGIAFESIDNIRTPHNPPAAWTLLVLAPIIIWKELSFRVVLAKGKRANSSALQAEAWHHRSDAITSITAFIGVSIATIFGEGYETADDWAALFASILILYNAYQIFRPAFAEVMDENKYEDLTSEIREVSTSVEGVEGTEKCFIRKSGMKYHVDLHARVDGNITVTEGHTIAHELKDTLKEEIPTLGHILIHIEPS